MRTPRSKLPVGIALTGLLAALWFFFAPPQLGGSTSFTATVGNSMEPMFHKGDLAVTRTASSYEVGDVALYISPVFHRPVLHRIIVIQNGRYYFKGDHNDFVDPGYVSHADIRGKLWYRVGGAGNALNWFGKPSHSALIAGLAVLLFVLGGAKRVTRSRRGRRRSSTSGRASAVKTPAVTAMLPSGLHRPRKSAENILAGVAGLLALVMLVVGFTSPVKRDAPVQSAYRHNGTFSYTARVTHPVSTYPSGIAHAGEPLYLSDFKTLNLGFSYAFASRLAHAVHGTIALKARITSDSNWHRDLSLGKARRFSGDRATVNGVLDLHELSALLNQLSVESGTVGAQYAVDVLPIVHVRGVVGTKHIDERFSPALPATVSPTMLKLNVSAPVTAPGASYEQPSSESLLESALNPSQAGTVPGIAPAFVSIARYQMTVSALRGLGLGLAALALLVPLTKPLRRKRRELWSPEKRIAYRYQCVIVDVVSIVNGAVAKEAPTEIPDFESLATLARYCERPILREAAEDAHVYAVEDGGRLYVYRSSAFTPAPLEVEAAEKPMPVQAPRHESRQRRRLLGGASLLLVLLVGLGLATAFTAATTVPVSYAGATLKARDLAQLTPAQCAGLTPTSLIAMTTATTAGTGASDLILGKNASGTITIGGGGANDCLVGGGGAGTTNKFDGGAGNGDVCIGAPGAINTFKNCETTY